MSLGISPESGRVLSIAAYPLETISAQALQADLQSFAAAALEWRRSYFLDQ
jgi:hypothetical protein